jgi:hypothetical protein
METKIPKSTRANDRDSGALLQNDDRLESNRVVQHTPTPRDLAGALVCAGDLLGYIRDETLFTAPAATPVTLSTTSSTWLLVFLMVFSASLLR